MTSTETELQQRLDECVEDWQCRLALSDHLQEIGDSRWKGYKALGLLRRHPTNTDKEKRKGWGWWFFMFSTNKDYAPILLPAKWWNKFNNRKLYALTNYSRQQCEDVAALAFSELTEDEQQEILNDELVEIE